MERWKDILGGTYSVSNNGVLKKHKTGRVSCGYKDAKGYIRFSVTINKKRFQLYAHRVVAEAFVQGRTEERNQVNHIDMCKSNNIYTNLEWVTQQENAEKAIAMGSKCFIKRRVVGIDAFGQKKEFNSINAASKFTGANAGNIQKCCKGVRLTTKNYRWKYIEQTCK
jgi:hypothetical protein